MNAAEEFLELFTEWEKEIRVGQVNSSLTKRLVPLGKSMGEEDFCRTVFLKNTRVNELRILREQHLELLYAVIGGPPFGMNNSDWSRLRFCLKEKLWTQWAEAEGYI